MNTTEKIIKEAEDYFYTTENYKLYKNDTPRMLLAAKYGVVTMKLSIQIEKLKNGLEMLKSQLIDNGFKSDSAIINAIETLKN